MLRPDLNEPCRARRRLHDDLLVVFVDLGVGLQHGLPG